MMSVLTFLLAAVMVLYAVFIAVPAIGLSKAVQRRENSEPSVSVIVVAKDEEESLPSCLESLGSLDYPPEKLEWILVNDRSSDATGILMRAFTDGRPRARVVSVEDLTEIRTGKTNGLIHGIRAAGGDVFFLTDADCIVPETWIRSTLSNYSPDTGIVAGFLLLDRKGKKDAVFARLQTLDWMVITAVGGGWSNLGLPLSAFGNNLTVRRQAYELAGGFESAGNHLTEDFALTRNVKRTGRYGVRIVPDHRTAVYTRPVRGVSGFLAQRKRWALGGKDHGPLVWFMMITAFLVHVLIPTVIVLGEWKTGLVAFAAATALDGLLLLRPLRLVRRLDLLKYLPLYELYYFAYSILIAPFFFAAKKVRWKSVTYHAEK